MDLLALVEAWFKRFPKVRDKRLVLLLDEFDKSRHGNALIVGDINP